MRAQFSNPRYDFTSVHNFLTCLDDNTYFTMKCDTSNDSMKLLVENTRREVVKDFGDPGCTRPFSGLSTLCLYNSSTILCLCYRQLSHFSLDSGKIEKIVILEKPLGSVTLNDDVRFKTGVDGNDFLCLWWFTSTVYFHDVHTGLITGKLLI
jgi:hypothetical protein